MTYIQRGRLMSFGIFTWASAMFAADESTVAVVTSCAPVMAGVGAGLFVAGLLPGRMARFS